MMPSELEQRQRYRTICYRLLERGPLTVEQAANELFAGNEAEAAEVLDEMDACLLRCITANGQQYWRACTESLGRPIDVEMQIGQCIVAKRMLRC